MDVQYQDTTRVYYTNYVRNSRAVGVMWAIFTICYAIIAIIVFIQPQWMGDTTDTVGTGYFGLYEFCQLRRAGQDHDCVGSLLPFDEIISDAFKASTVLVGIGVILMLVCVVALLLFFVIKASKAYLTCGILQLITALLMILGCVVYPAGWDAPEVIRICGSRANMYSLGNCTIRWAYILCIIGIFDALVLSILAFVLSARQARWPENAGLTGALTKSELNGYAIETESRPSMIIQPVLTVPETGPDHYSEYSHASARRSNKRGDFSL